MIITRQTQKERELLNIAKEIINSFENEVAAIGGSLMLSCMGIRKLRESNDIDIVLKRDYYKKVWGAHEDDYFLTEHLKDRLNSNNIKVQKHIERGNDDIFFDMLTEDGASPYDEVFSFILENETKVDFLLSETDCFYKKDGFCYSSLNDLFYAKNRYMHFNNKHAQDICYMYEHNMRIYIPTSIYTNAKNILLKNK